MSINRRKFLGSVAAASGALLAGCAATSQPAAGTRRGDGGPVIDVHAHWHAPAFVALLEKEAGANGAKVGRNDKGYVTFTMPGLGSVFQPQYIDLDIRLQAMNSSGVNMHALSLTSPMVYWAPPAFGARLSQVCNDELVRAHQLHPTRFVGLAMLPM